jgi:hypothetical protein
MRKIGIAILFLFLLFLFTACGTTETSTEIQNNTEGTVEISAVPSVENTVTSTLTETAIQPSLTPTITLTPTEAITATPTLDVQGVKLAYYDFFYNKNSYFAFDLNYASGEYYGTGRVQDGTILTYNCEFRPDHPNRVVCGGAPVALGGKIYFQLFKKETDEVVFSNAFIYNYPLHGEVIPSPTGVTCEIEPQWNGKIPAHQLDVGCFAMSCWQNGKYLWGTDNTCRDAWPFPWDFTHPLHTPGT